MAWFNASGIAVIVVACAIPACSNRDSLVPARDLIAGFNQADRRPSSAVFEVTEVTIAGVPQRAIATEPVSRVTWLVAIPDRAVVKTALALKPEAWAQEGNGVLFRIGISEGRSYEELLTRYVDPFHRPADRGWIPVTVDLAAYGGFKWSLFYQPRYRTWKLIFNTNAGPPGTDGRFAGLPLWGEPMIYRYDSRP